MSDPYHNSPHEMSDDPNDTAVMTTYGQPDEFEEYEDLGAEGGLPERPRRVLVNRWTALLAAIVIGGACFYAGVRVEKSDTASSSTTSAFSALASRFGAASGSGTASSAATGTGSGFGSGDFGGGTGAGTTGTISTIDGNTLYITETGGNTVKVKLSKATTLTKSETVGKSKLYPGDTVSVAGPTGSSGKISATSISDSGNNASSSRSSSSGTGSTSSTGTSGSSSSGLNSLFGG